MLNGSRLKAKQAAISRPVRGERAGDPEDVKSSSQKEFGAGRKERIGGPLLLSVLGWLRTAAPSPKLGTPVTTPCQAL